jgi:hypothetical protein
MLMFAIITFLSICGLGLFTVFLIALSAWMSDNNWPMPFAIFTGIIVPFATVMSFLVYFIGGSHLSE